MNFTFKQMTQEEAETIAYKWKYKDKYSFYDITEDKEDLKEILDIKGRKNFYFSVFRDNKLIGYFTFKIIEPKTVIIGLGMHPDHVGKGEGLSFLTAGIEYAQERYSNSIFTLSVAEFNVRAIKVYEHAGFEKIETFIQETNGGKYPFMALPAIWWKGKGSIYLSEKELQF